MSENAVNLRPTNQSAPNAAVGAARRVLATARDASKRPLTVHVAAADMPSLYFALLRALSGEVADQRLLVGLFETINLANGKAVQL